MNTRYGKALGITAIVGTFLVAGAGSFAVTQALAGSGQDSGQTEGRRGPGRGMWMGGGMSGPGLMGFGQLDLTEGQRQSIRGIIDQHREQFQAAGQRLRDARRSLHEATSATPMNEDLIRQRSMEVAAVEADTAVLRARVAQDIQGILTPEQQAKLEELRSDRQKRMEERHQRFEQRRQQRQPPAGGVQQPQRFRGPALDSNRSQVALV